MKFIRLILPIFILLLITLPVTLTAQRASLDYSLFIMPFENLTQDLEVHAVGLHGYYPSPEGQRLGWSSHISIPVTSPQEPFWGGIDVLLLLGQEIFLGPLLGSANCYVGGGLSYSNLGDFSVCHFSAQGRGELEFGLQLSTFFIATVFVGVGGFVNLLPDWPTQEYVFWQFYAGGRLSWIAQSSNAS